MGFVLNRFPVPARLKSQVHSEKTDRFIFWRLVEVAGPFEHADVERDAEVVI